MSRTTPEIRVIISGAVWTFTEWSDELLELPITQVMAFHAPDPPPSPHTPEQHDAIAAWPERLRELMMVAKQNRRCQP